MADGSSPVTRLIDRLCALGWSKRVVLQALPVDHRAVVPAAFWVDTTRELQDRLLASGLANGDAGAQAGGRHRQGKPRRTQARTGGIRCLAAHATAREE